MGSAYSNVVQITAGTVTLILQPVVQSTFSLGGIPQNQNALSWNDVGADHYDVWRQLNGGGFAFLKSVTGLSTTDLGPVSSWISGEYDYFVIAKTAAGVTIVQSNTVSTTWAPPAMALTWTARSNGLNVAGGGAFGANNVAILTGGIGTIMRSADNGSTWSQLNLIGVVGSVSVNDVAFGNGIWVIVCGAGKIARSIDDGVSWALAVSNPLSAGAGVSTVAYGNGTFVAGQTSGTAGTGLYAVSADGNTWTQPNTYNTKGWDNHGMLFDGTLFSGLVTKSDNSTGLASSPDGSTWSTLTAPPDPQRNTSMAFGNGLYIAGNHSTQTVRMASTLAGLASAPDTPTSLGGSTGVISVGYGLVGGAPTFITMGFQGQTASSSDNGVTWTPGILNFSSTNSAADVCFNGTSIFIANGFGNQISTYP